MQKFWSGSFSLIHPNKFKEVVGLYHPQFQDYRQVCAVGSIQLYAILLAPPTG